MEIKRRLILLVLAELLVLGQVVILAMVLIRSPLGVDARGVPLPTDFVGLWSAGQFVLQGTPQLAYDWTAIGNAQEAMLQTAEPHFYPFSYPPHYLFVAAAIASMPYTVAFFLFSIGSAALFVLTIALIIGDWRALLYALATPALFPTMIIGQSSCLMGALMGLMLLYRERAPACSGPLLGLLTYKPHFGLLFPIALVTERRWAIIGYGLLTTMALLAASYLAFGQASYMGFFTSVFKVGQEALTEGKIGFAKFQSIYAFVRFLNIGETWAWILHGIVSLMAVAGVVRIWRGSTSHSLRSAVLVAASLLVSPYIFPYDLVVYGIAVAFLYRDTPFNDIEWGVIILASGVIYALLVITLPIGSLAPLAVIGIALSRVQSSRRTDIRDKGF